MAETSSQSDPQNPADPQNPSGQRILASQRHDEILRRLNEDGVAGISEVAAFFDVSRETIRRDLKLLAQRGLLALVHGGATKIQLHEPAFGLRSQENSGGKAVIGQAACALIRSGMVVFLDSGTTTLALAQALTQQDKAPENLTICTTSLRISLQLCHVPTIRVHILGGEISPEEEASGGIDVLQALEHFRFDLAFLGTGGITAEGEITDFTRNGAELRSRLAVVAGEAWFLASAEKFGRMTPLRVAHYEQAAGIITDHRPEPQFVTALAEKGLRLHIS